MEINKRKKVHAFTMIEINVVVVILSIAALIAVPMVGSAADMQARAACNQIAADIEYAKNMAITHQENYSVDFNSSAESYSIKNASGTVIANPLRPSTDYTVNFSGDSRFDQINISTANFDSDLDEAVTFDYLGSPYKGLSTATPLNSGRITISAGNFTLYVDVEPVTGFVTITE